MGAHSQEHNHHGNTTTVGAQSPWEHSHGAWSWEHSHGSMTTKGARPREHSYGSTVTMRAQSP